MIISRTPYRVSFFGGGTDFPEWFSANGGAVLSTSIDRYCYLTCRELPRFFDHKHRIVYSMTETVSSVEEIRHPAVREALRYMGITVGMEIHHDGDLPASSGIGSSSAFAVGILNALRALTDVPVSPIELAHEAVKLERELLREAVGLQDQFACALGGMNYMEFGPGETVKVQPLLLSAPLEDEISERMVLVYSGKSRSSHKITETLVAGLGFHDQRLCELREMASRGREVLEQGGDLDEFGEMLKRAFRIKGEMSPHSVPWDIEALYDRGMSRGALGGKVLGAGGGGFIMFWLKRGDRERFLEEMRDHLIVPAHVDHSGSVILFDAAAASRSVTAT